jgi:hypothetical protein
VSALRGHGLPADASGRALQTLKGHANWVGAVAVTPDGRRGSVALRTFSPKTPFRAPMGSLFYKGFRFTDKSGFW